MKFVRILMISGVFALGLSHAHAGPFKFRFDGVQPQAVGVASQAATVSTTLPASFSAEVASVTETSSFQRSAAADATAVAEPGTLLLLGAGAMVIGMVCRRRS